MKAYIEKSLIHGEVVETKDGKVTKLKVFNPVTNTHDIIDVMNDTVIILKGLIVIAKFLKQLIQTIIHRP